MDSISTPLNSTTSHKSKAEGRKARPAQITIECLRQFARSYRAVAGMGVCLN